jgi:acyl transferase domain-containing protein/thioesterase domain-containing protein
MSKENIAIIGIGCRFPKAKNHQEFWKMLLNGTDAITEADCQLDTGITGWGGFLEERDKFDANFFGISAQEAITIDPQQRFLLEVAWEALEDAGQIPENLAGSETSVFVGISCSDYHQVVSQQQSTPSLDATTGNHRAMVANRISYHFDFHGTSIAVNTACSSSLVALDQACQSLLVKENSLALACGVNMLFVPTVTDRFMNAGLLSANGRCHSFDANADGYVRSEGIGVVVLKRLSQAEADGDRIYAVIRGSNVNHNGRSNGLTAPNLKSQISLLSKTYHQAGIAPNSVHYIEAQGTATSIGDTLEMKALGSVVGKDRSPDNPCRVGCVKTNIGHTEAASGIAGLIKTVLMLYHRQIPPNLHFQKPNPLISFEKLGLKIQQNLETFPEEIYPIRAGISSFGFGGTNAHIVLEEYASPVKPQRVSSRMPLQVLTLATKTPNALRELANLYKIFLQEHDTISLDDVCFTANTKRSHFKHRLAIITKSKEVLTKQLKAYINQESNTSVLSGELTRRSSPIIYFVVSGNGLQFKNVVTLFYSINPKLFSFIDQCNKILYRYFQKHFLEVINHEYFNSSSHVQLVNFLLEYAIAKLWQSWGVEPNSIIGYGLGNYVAATLSDVLSLEDVIDIILRNKDIQSVTSFQAAKIPIISSVNGTTINRNQLISIEQWQENFQVDFNSSKNLINLGAKTSYILLDIYSCKIKNLDNNSLSSSLDIKSKNLNLDDQNCDGLYRILSTVSELWLMGITVDWSNVGDYQKCNLISLPNYPFQRQSYWVSSAEHTLPKEQEHSPSVETKEMVNDLAIANPRSNISTDLYLSKEFISPRNDIEQKLATIWQKTLKCNPIGIHDNFFELGGTSLLATKALTDIDQTFHVNMAISAIYQAPTIESLAQLLSSEFNIVNWYSLVPIQKQGSRPILFGIHWLVYKDLSKHLGLDQPIYGLSYGIGDTTGHVPPLPNIKDLAKHYIQEMRSLQPYGPYFLMGYSFGGVVAYEMAQQLQEENQLVSLVVLLDSYIGERKLLPMPKRIGKILKLSVPELYRRTLGRLQMKLLGIIYRNQYIPQVYIADVIINALNCYIPQSYSGRVILFKATNSSQSINFEYTPVEAEWKKYVGDSLEIHEIHGDHLSILKEPLVQSLSEKLIYCIDQVLDKDQLAK